MSKYHINGKGEVGKCRALLHCPFGGDSDHYSSPEAARAAYEASAETFIALKKQSRREELAAAAPLESPNPTIVERAPLLGWHEMEKTLDRVADRGAAIRAFALGVATSATERGSEGFFSTSYDNRVSNWPSGMSRLEMPVATTMAEIKAELVPQLEKEFSRRTLPGQFRDSRDLSPAATAHKFAKNSLRRKIVERFSSLSEQQLAIAGIDIDRTYVDGDGLQRSVAEIMTPEAWEEFVDKHNWVDSLYHYDGMRDFEGVAAKYAKRLVANPPQVEGLDEALAQVLS